MTEGERLTPQWLALREPADAAARAADLADLLGRHVPATGRWVIHDLGCGTGSMGRWLAPRLPGRSTGSCTTGTPTCSPWPSTSAPARVRMAPASRSSRGRPTSRHSAPVTSPARP